MRNQFWKWRSRPPFLVSRPGSLQRHGAEPPARRGLLRGTDPAQPGRPRPEAPGGRRVLRALLRPPVGRREGGVKHSSSASSSSHKKKKSSSSSSREAKKRSRDKSPHRSPAQSSLPGTPRSQRVEAQGFLSSPPPIPRTPVPATPAAAGILPVDPRTPVPSAPAVAPGTPAGASLPALSLPSQWEMQLFQQQAMSSVPYSFHGQQPF